MQILGIILGKKSVDDVISGFTTILIDLDGIAERETTRSSELRDEAERLTQEANAATGEAWKARTVRGRIAKLVQEDSPPKSPEAA